MTSPLRRLVPASAVAALAAAACVISTAQQAGAPCRPGDECADPLYACLPDPALDGGHTCQVVFPARQPAAADAGGDAGGDAGVDAGPVPTVYYCGAVQQALTTWCAACHGETRGGSNNLPFRVDVYEDLDGGASHGGLDGAKTKAPLIKYRTTDIQNMPPLGSPMPDPATRQLIGQWVTTGAQFCDGGM